MRSGASVTQEIHWKGGLDDRANTCHSTRVTLLRIQFRPGESIFEQVVFAAIKAFVSGEYRPGQAFPSVRSLAAELKIHPNTAHKVIQHLIQERWLEARPGIGTIVAERPEPRPGERARMLRHEAEQLAVEAKRVGASLADVTRAIEEQWAKLERKPEVKDK